MSNRCKALEGKIAVITGAAQGLGEALAHRLDKEGCKVVVADINIEKARMVANSLTDAAPSAWINKRRAGERTDEISCGYLRDDRYPVSNAAILISKATTDFPLDEWKKMMDVNINGYFLCARAAARIMAEKGTGSIIQINSKSGKKGSYKNAAYATSKFAGIGLTQSLALEMAECGVRVNAICPGNLLDSPLWVNSLYKQYAANQGITEEEVRQKYLDQVPMKRGCTYDDVANLMVFLASDQSSYMTGQAINVTGGQEMR